MHISVLYQLYKTISFYMTKVSLIHLQGNVYLHKFGFTFAFVNAFKINLKKRKENYLVCG